MRFPLLLLLVMLCCTNVHSQGVYSGATFDYNTGIGERYTYGIGFHLEARVFRPKNLYLNWHYSIGANTHGEFYGHGGMSLLLYKDSDWWRVNSWEGLVGAVIGPLFIPNGVTYYLPNQPMLRNGRHVRIGMYCNPISLEYWNTKPYKVTSWTIESGAKLLYELDNHKFIYLAGGVSFTNNIRRAGRRAGFGSEELVHIQLGLLGWTD